MQKGRYKDAQEHVEGPWGQGASLVWGFCAMWVENRSFELESESYTDVIQQKQAVVVGWNSIHEQLEVGHQKTYFLFNE